MRNHSFTRLDSQVTQHRFTCANSAAITSDSSWRLEFPTVQGSVSVRCEKALTRQWRCVGSESIWATFFWPGTTRSRGNTLCTHRRDKTWRVPRGCVVVNRLLLLLLTESKTTSISIRCKFINWQSSCNVFDSKVWKLPTEV